VVITDLPAAQANIAWYALRTWIEAGFKDREAPVAGAGITVKCARPAGLSGSGWQWPWRSSGRWPLAVKRIVKCRWPLSSTCLQRTLPESLVKRQPGQPPDRRLSCPQRGRLVLLAALVRAEDWPVGTIVAEPWPERVTPLKRVVSPTKVQKPAQKQARKRQYKAARRRKQAA
jgi:hypothetical protein